jgi:hypothetical protein
VSGSIAGALAIGIRLWFTIVELVCFTCAFCYGRRSPQIPAAKVVDKVH